MRLILLILGTMFLPLSCSDSAPTVPDEPPDAGPLPPSSDELEDCCDCLSRNSASSENKRTNCFQGDVADCVALLRLKNGIITPNECLTDLCKDDCGFIIIEESD
ncbi:MAG: hypothetical protein Kow0090_02060 [Myxococcota bacterium]